ncbi:MAG: hypothetical protein IAE96_06565 [Chitinophagaceae bacterium]|nr:hypothetical protein [Chitinophagaceae bacterium]
MNAFNPAGYYHEQIQLLGDSLAEKKKKSLLLSWLRLISFTGTLFLVWQVWYLGAGAVLLAFVTGGALFAWLVNRDLDNKALIENLQRLIRVCEQEINVLQHNYRQYPDGSRYLSTDHPAAADLDLFGRSSLFQYINRTQTEQGEKMLASWLLIPATPAELDTRQAAIKELARQPEWIRQLQAHGAARKLTISAEEKISQWLKEKNLLAGRPGWNITRYLFPLLSFSILALFLSNQISQSLFLTSLTILLASSLVITKQLMPSWKSLGRISEELDSFSESILHIESLKSNSPLLIQQVSAFRSAQRVTASDQIKALKRIMDRLDYRLNPVVYIPLSIFFCWDLQQVFALEKWKTRNKEGISHWFSSLGVMETLSSLATLHFNQPGWVFPQIREGLPFSARALGHPLIPENKRVNNDFSQQANGTISLITGSNMAGKSTFLRSCGVNMVLAMAGAPVCALYMAMAPFRVMSSMRISDNLEESTSTFYAELKKLKAIIEAVNRKENVFLLLDEILRGTNSADRHTGSKALIRQLIAHGATGIIATHDLELASLKQDFPDQLFNFHFDVQMEGEELYFDYVLKEGICRSMNASLLMKKIGIELPSHPSAGSV